MSSSGFYDGPVEPGFGDQMDPLGTAATASTAGAASFAQPETAPAGAVSIGKAKVKKKLSTGKKIAYGAGGSFALFALLLIVLPSGQPKVNASPKPHVATAAPAAAAPGQMLGAEAAGAQTVMGGAPTPAPADPAAVAPAPATSAPSQSQAAAVAPAGAQPASSQASPAAALAQAPIAAPAVTTAAAAPALAPVAAPAVTPAAAAPVSSAAAVNPAQPTTSGNPRDKGHSTVKAETPSASPEQLASRVALLERRLARYERAEAQDRARSAKEAARASLSQSWRAASEKVILVAQPAIESKKPAVLPSATLRVVGVSTRHGVTSALVDFAGVKSRVSQGDSIPGLGTVQSIAVDAAGIPVVEVNGVRYQ